MKKTIASVMTLSLLSLTGCGNTAHALSTNSANTVATVANQSNTTTNESNTTTDNNNTSTSVPSFPHVVNDELPYAGGTFDPQGLMGESDNYYIREYGNGYVLIVFWDIYGNEEHASVAQNGKWIVTDRNISNMIKKNIWTQGTYGFQLAKNGIYAVTISPTQDSYTVGKALYIGHYENLDEYPLFIDSNIGTSLVVKNANNQYVIIPPPNSKGYKAVVVNDKYNELKDASIQYMNWDKQTLYFIYTEFGNGNEDFKGLNVNTGEPVYDENGQDKIVKLPVTASSTNSLGWCTTGIGDQIYNLSYIHHDSLSGIDNIPVMVQHVMSLNTQLNEIATDLTFQYRASTNAGVWDNPVSVTTDGKVIHAWLVTNYEHQKVLERVTINP